MNDISEAFDKAIFSYIRNNVKEYNLMQKRVAIHPLFASMLLKNILWYFVEYNEFTDEGMDMILIKTQKEFEVAYNNME